MLLIYIYFFLNIYCLLVNIILSVFVYKLIVLTLLNLIMYI